MTKYPSMAFKEMLYDTDKSMGHDGSTEGAVWCHCKPASIIIKRLWWLAKVSAKCEKARHPYLQEWQVKGFRELDLISLTLTLGNVMEKITLKIISSYFKMVFGSSQHRFTTEEIMSNQPDSFLWRASHWMRGDQRTGSQTTTSRWPASAGGQWTRCTPKAPSSLSHSVIL